MNEVRVRQLADSESPATVEAALRDEGFAPFRWGNAAGYHYPPHSHDYESVIVCTTGSITFHVAGSDMELRPGDRIDLPAEVEHAATVGVNGVECLEGTR
jgi:quercetin dioxygenase-like cupin family protein